MLLWKYVSATVCQSEKGLSAATCRVQAFKPESIRITSNPLIHRYTRILILNNIHTHAHRHTHSGSENGRGTNIVVHRMCSFCAYRINIYKYNLMKIYIDWKKIQPLYYMANFMQTQISSILTALLGLLTFRVYCRFHSFRNFQNFKGGNHRNRVCEPLFSPQNNDRLSSLSKNEVVSYLGECHFFLLDLKSKPMGHMHDISMYILESQSSNPKSKRESSLSRLSFVQML